MFDRAVIDGLLREKVAVPHTISVLSPYSFAIAPLGLTPGAEYRVIVDRSAFELRLRVATPYLGAGVRAAIVAGVNAAPHRLERLERMLTDLGWDVRFEVSADECRLDAHQAGVLELGSYELTERAVEAAAMLSGFVIDQLLVTMPFGEARPAILRHVSEDLESADPWLYDPEERDRSTAIHRALENWLISRVTEAGLQPLDPTSEPFFDLAWVHGGTMFVCEVKSTVNSETIQLRLAVGQLIHYLALLALGGIDRTQGVILVSARPSSPEWEEIASRLKIVLLWPERWDEVADQLVGTPD